MHQAKKDQMPRSGVSMLKIEVEATYKKLCRNTFQNHEDEKLVEFLNEEARVALNEAYETVRHQLPLKRNEGESIRAFLIKSAFTKRNRKRQLKRC